MSNNNESKSVDDGRVIVRTGLIDKTIKAGGFLDVVEFHSNETEYYYLYDRNYNETELTKEEWEWIKSKYDGYPVEKPGKYVTETRYQFA